MAAFCAVISKTFIRRQDFPQNAQIGADGLFIMSAAWLKGC
jgi:hypothetical protein